MEPVQGNSSFLLRFGKNKASPRAQMFAWKCLRDMVHCRDKIANRLSLTDTSCPICSSPSETLYHLLLECDFAWAVWFGTSFGVIRDANNVFGVARVSSYRFASAKEGEALAILNGIRWAQEWGHQQTIIETDVEAIYTFCRTGCANISWTTKAILQECLALFVSFVNIHINFAPRSANTVAHVVAARPMDVISCWTWYDPPQEWLHPYLEADRTSFVTHFAY
ncbi:hypothetical protein GIB67_035216 [Kingdonia uniflora]|uniref:RNase H type-1 domain-containing protein n=1 Tax=Kingdonia uniflora TaxID=39325 RepID=A0A7J7KXP6_9MAGN|nr:hypothetical protein GIB67_035216 [Kingdonia uniflora]